MPLNFKSFGKIAVCFSVGLVAGMAYKGYMNRAPARQVASPNPAFRPLELGKALAPLKVEIQRPSHLPERDDEEVVLTARVLISQDVGNELSFKWILPDGVTAVDGQISDSVTGIQQGQTLELKLSVIGFSREEQKVIAFSTTGVQNGSQVGNSAVVVSRPEDTWESVAPEMQKGAEEQLGTGRERRNQ